MASRGYELLDKPLIDPAKCDGCGVCVSVCRQAALSLTGKTVSFSAETECPWCGDCEAVCPSGAISCPYEIIVSEG